MPQKLNRKHWWCHVYIFVQLLTIMFHRCLCSFQSGVLYSQYRIHLLCKENISDEDGWKKLACCQELKHFSLCRHQNFSSFSPVFSPSCLLLQVTLNVFLRVSWKSIACLNLQMWPYCGLKTSDSTQPFIYVWQKSDRCLKISWEVLFH